MSTKLMLRLRIISWTASTASHVVVVVWIVVTPCSVRRTTAKI
jgi:hypothetical protein